MAQPRIVNRTRRRRSRWLLFLLLPLPAGCTAQQTASATIRSCTIGRISDGDSLRCTDGRRVRLIGIDSPELQQRPFGPQAQQALLVLLPLGTTVRLETDAVGKGRFSRRFGLNRIEEGLVIMGGHIDDIFLRIGCITSRHAVVIHSAMRFRCRIGR